MLRRPIVVLLAWFAVSSSAQASTAFFVSTQGRDDNPGTLAQPFKTLPRAQLAVRQALRSAEGPITVSISDGTYEMSEPLRFGPADSGTQEARVTWKSLNPLGARVSGGRQLPATSFVPLRRRAADARFSPEVAAHLIVIDLATTGIGHVDPLSLERVVPSRDQRPAQPELIFAERVMTLARWPNDGWARTGRVTNLDAVAAPPGGGSRRGGFLVDDNRAARWNGPNVWVYGYWLWDWYDEGLRVTAVDAPAGGIAVTGTLVYGLKQNRRFYVVNAPGELDAPGEYYVDNERKELYFWPPAAAGDATAALTVLEEPIVEMSGASDLTLEGWVVENGRGTGVQVTGGNRVHISRCAIRNVGTSGIDVRGGTGHVIEQSSIHDTGTRGILVSGGDRIRLIDSGHRVTGNQIYSVGRRIAASEPAIDIDGVGVRIEHNRIRDTPQASIMFAGNNHLIQGNEIEAACSDSADCGAIYTGRDWTSQGTEVRDNAIRAIVGAEDRSDVTAIYLDDLASGITVSGNTIVNVKRGILVGGGRDNTITGNVFSDAAIPISVDSRGVRLAARINSPGSEWMKRLARLPYRTEPWSTRYPRLKHILDDEPALPKRNVVADNRFSGSGAMVIDPLVRLLGTVRNNDADEPE